MIVEYFFTFLKCHFYSSKWIFFQFHKTPTPTTVEFFFTFQKWLFIFIHQNRFFYPFSLFPFTNLIQFFCNLEMKVKRSFYRFCQMPKTSNSSNFYIFWLFLYSYISSHHLALFQFVNYFNYFVETL